MPLAPGPAATTLSDRAGPAGPAGRAGRVAARSGAPTRSRVPAERAVAPEATAEGPSDVDAPAADDVTVVVLSDVGAPLADFGQATFER